MSFSNGKLIKLKGNPNMLKNFSYGTCVLMLFLVLAIFTPAILAQDEPNRVDASAVAATGDVVDDFIPEGWKIENNVAGDLNNDGKADHAITMIEEKPETDKDGAPVERSRGLVIVFGQKDGKLTKAAVADRLLQCPNCGGAFYGAGKAPANVSIEKGVLVIQQDHGSRWVTDTTYRFRYDEQPAMFILIGFDYSSRDRNNGTSASESTNYVTGKRVTTPSKGKAKTTIIKKMRYSLEEVDSDKFDEEATKRLGLD
jgi:hypothetical protein